MRSISHALATVVLFFFALGMTPAEAQSDSDIRQMMIAESLRSYSGNCPCPYNVDRAGRRCGGRSAYSRPGGASPLCYPTDISAQMLQNYARQRGLR